MPLYKYVGIKKDGTTVKGRYFASDYNALKTELAKQRIKLISHNRLGERRTSNFFAVSSKVSMKEFVTFVTQLSIMIKAGSSIPDSLNVLRNQTFTTYFKNVISDVYESVLKGEYLSDALDDHPKVFPSFFTSMVYIGELSGNLSMVLDESVKYYENDQKMKKKAKSAMIYPIFLLVIITAVFFLLMLMVVPQFVDMINSFGGEVPLITKIVSNLSAFIVKNVAYIAIIAFTLIFGGILFFKKTRLGKQTSDWIKYHCPVIKTITKNTITTRFCSAFAILLSSGMNVLDCLKAMPRIIDNIEFSKRFKKTIRDVNDGEKLTTALDRSEVFPQMLIQMTSVGERSSSLETVYKTVESYYAEELAASISRATALLEPITIIILGVIVLIVILSIMLPLFSLMSAIQ